MTTEETAVAELQKKIEERDNELADLKKKIDGLDSLNGKRGTEIGEVRKQLEELAELKKAITDLKEDRDALKKELDEVKTLKSKEPEGKKDTSPPEPKLSDKEKAEKLESELNEDERKEVEGFVSKLTADDRKRFVSDDAYRVAVLSQVKSKEDGVNPDSIWRIPPKKKASGDDLEKTVSELFKKYKSGNLVVDERSGGYGSASKPKAVNAPPKFL